MVLVKREPKSGTPSTRLYDIVVTLPVWISAAAALVTAAVTRLVAPVWSFGPHGDGGTSFVQSVCAWAIEPSVTTASTTANVTSAFRIIMEPLSRRTEILMMASTRGGSY